MKQIISAIAIAGLFGITACNNSAVKEKDATLQAQQHTIDSMNSELAKKKVIDSMNEVVKTQYVMTPPAGTAPAAVAPAAAVQSHSAVHHAVHHSAGSTAATMATTTTVAQPEPVAVQQAPEPEKKKGWSAKAKGAVIGTATGAAAGAIINKRNRGAGAIIGGVLGAAAGTGTGAVIDKKNGR